MFLYLNNTVLLNVFITFLILISLFSLLYKLQSYLLNIIAEDINYTITVINAYNNLLRFYFLQCEFV